MRKLYVINKILWRLRNKHNNTYMANNFNIDQVKIGNHSYGPLDVRIYNDGTLNIGNYVSIADNVTFLLGGGARL